MRRARPLLACVMLLTGLALSDSATALAAGSAAGSQYTDPLANTTPRPSSSPGSSPSSAQGSSSSSVSSGSSSSLSGSASSLSSSPPSQGGSSSSESSAAGAGAASSGSARSLPFTGLNVWACLAVGFGLMGSGLLLRYALRSA